MGGYRFAFACIRMAICLGTASLLTSCGNKTIRPADTDASVQTPISAPTKINGGNAVPGRPVVTSPRTPDQLASPASQLPDPANTVYFSPGSTALGGTAYAVIDAIANKLSDSHFSVVLIGRSDDQASNEYRIAVSGSRVAVVEAELLKRGVKRSQIRERLLGKGSFAPIDCDSRLCRQSGRSVELLVTE